MIRVTTADPDAKPESPRVDTLAYAEIGVLTVFRKRTYSTQRIATLAIASYNPAVAALFFTPVYGKRGIFGEIIIRAW